MRGWHGFSRTAHAQCEMHAELPQKQVNERLGFRRKQSRQEIQVRGSST